MVVGFDPGNGRSCQRSFTIHGDAEHAQRQRRELVDLWGVTRVAITSEGAQLTTADLLDRYRRACEITVAGFQSPRRRSHRSPPADQSDSR